MRRILIAGAALALTACADGSAPPPGPAIYDPYYWDYGFRYGIYDYHYGDDADFDRPDRPDRPGAGDPRPTHPIAAPPRAQPPRAAARPAGGFGRGAGARGGGRGGGRR